MAILEVSQGELTQSADESLTYTISTTNWASSPTSPSVQAYDESANNADVTSTVFPTNSPSVSNDIITLSPLKSLIKGKQYRIEVKFTVSPNIYECYFRVTCPI